MARLAALAGFIVSLVTGELRLAGAGLLPGTRAAFFFSCRTLRAMSRYPFT
jgi:putative intracellular protease/amidase